MVLLPEICFLMDKFYIFINKNSNTYLAQYTTSRQNEITELLDKDIFKVITFKNIRSKAWIFNSCFVNKIKNLKTDKAYEKIWLIVYVYKNKKKI